MVYDMNEPLIGSHINYAVSVGIGVDDSEWHLEVILVGANSNIQHEFNY